jgi:hypothetical protein
VDRKNLGDCDKPQPGTAEALAGKKIEVRITGDASERAHGGLQQLGISLVEHAGQRLPLLD